MINEDEFFLRRQNLILMEMAETTLAYVHDSGVSPPEIRSVLWILRGARKREEAFLDSGGNGDSG